MNFLKIKILEPNNFTVKIYDAEQINDKYFRSSYNLKIQAYLTDILECQQNCNYNGVCFHGQCICNPDFVGYDCSKNLKHNGNDDWYIQKINFNSAHFDRGANFQIDLSVKGIVYFKTIINGLYKYTLPSNQLDNLDIIYSQKSF